MDLEIERAKVLGVLGPNGAGKTTTVLILTTLLKPDAGRAVLDGIDVVAEPRRARARIGVTGQYAAVDERLSGFENLEHGGRLFHLCTAVAKDRASELLERFGLLYNGRPPESDLWVAIAWAIGITVVFAWLAARKFASAAAK